VRERGAFSGVRDDRRERKNASRRREKVNEGKNKQKKRGPPGGSVNAVRTTGSLRLSDRAGGGVCGEGA
jgi:hypothetical protein